MGKNKYQISALREGGGDIDFRFGIGKVEDKKISKELVKTLLKKFNVPSAVASMTSVTAKFPEMLTAIKKFDMEMGSIFIEFPNPKETIAFKVSGIGDLGVKKVMINDDNEVVVTFKKIDKNGWGERELEANLGEQDKLAIPFWNQIWCG